MRIIVDSSVWIGFLNGQSNAQTLLLEQHLKAESEICILPIIAQEVLQGVRDEAEFNKVLSLIANTEILAFALQESVEAAEIYRKLRRKGKTPTSIDVQIAAVAIGHSAAVLTSDADFKILAKETGLKLI